MDNKFTKWLRENYSKIINSIAFYPAIIAIGFLILSVLMQEFDFSAAGKHIKASASWISLRDANTARAIVSTIAGGIISLTVFSFSMVMIVLNQAASQMSNRMLEGMIANRFQQFVLGVYIGSIVYALSLLTTIRDIDSGIYIPALSIYLLLLITVVDIFIFIYFLHYVTQSVKFQTIISRVHDDTIRSLKQLNTEKPPTAFLLPNWNKETVCMESSGYFQGFNKKQLINFAQNNEGIIHFLKPASTYLLKGIPLLDFYSLKKLDEDKLKEIFYPIDFYDGQEIQLNSYYGFHQLAEVALKALSPGINDPETAVLSLHAITDLFSYKLNHFTQSIFEDENGVVRIQTRDWTFEEFFAKSFYPIWEYGKKDLYIQNAMLQMVGQLRECDVSGSYTVLFTHFLSKVNKQIEQNQFERID
ncbi:MAG: DUF2254 domain-containing protein [Ginsengibacter sp.]